MQTARRLQAGALSEWRCLDSAFFPSSPSAYFALSFNVNERDSLRFIPVTPFSFSRCAFTLNERSTLGTSDLPRDAEELLVQVEANTLQAI